MRSMRLFVEQPLTVGQQVTLDEKRSHYLQHVLRAAVGNSITVFDGSGRDYLARIETLQKKSLQLSITGAADPLQHIAESPLRSVLAIAISKGERMDWIMQKATELGITAIQPLISQHMALKMDAARAEKKQRHWQGVVVSACEQCGRSVVPQVAAARKLTDWLDSSRGDLKLIFTPGGESFSSIAEAQPCPPAEVSILIGAEGGFSEAEMTQAKQCDFVGIGFSPRILRTETAPVVALTLLQQRWGDG